jgi:hypothetical protein
MPLAREVCVPFLPIKSQETGGVGGNPVTAEYG